MTVLPDICFSSSLSFIWYFPIPFVAKSFWNVTLRDWEVYWLPRTEVLRWSLSSDTVKFHIGILYLFLGYSFHLFLCWLSSDTLLSSDWVLGHRPSPFQCKLYLWDQLAPTVEYAIQVWVDNIIYWINFQWKSVNHIIEGNIMTVRTQKIKAQAHLN